MTKRDKSTKRYNEEGMRMTDCCGSMSSYYDAMLCCKTCFREVDAGQGDGAEYVSGPRPSIRTVWTRPTEA
jgi:ribosomal protein S14